MSGRLSVNMFVVLAVLLVTAAALPARAVIQIYGRDSCSNCQALMKSLQEHGISYIFFNVDKNSSWNDEMWKKVHSVDPSLKYSGRLCQDMNSLILS